MSFSGNKLKIEDKTKKQAIMDGVDLLAHLPTGRAMRLVGLVSYQVKFDSVLFKLCK